MDMQCDGQVQDCVGHGKLGQIDVTTFLTPPFFMWWMTRALTSRHAVDELLLRVERDGQLAHNRMS